MSQLAKDDWELFHGLHTNPDIIKYCFDMPSLAQIEKRFHSRLPKWTVNSRQWLCMVISDRKSKCKVGITGFVFDGAHAEVGFMLEPRFKGQNIATESLLATIEWARKEHNIIQFKAVVSEGNHASERVLQKCGFRLVQVDSKAYQIGGKLYADHHYQLSLS